MYDFTHCISDSIEHIDYSLCSLEFEIRRELYYIFLDLLGLYKPTVWEYSRLNIEGNVLSKRKIKELIENKTVDGWDDPRLLTIRGLRNRGYTP
jgi:glutaminyl-tRNA synthetase